MAGTPDVVHVVVRRIRPLPAAEVRGDRGGLLVGARPAVVLGSALPRSEGRREAVVTGDPDPCRASCSTATASSASSNTKRREIGMRYEIGIDNMLVGQRLPAPRGHLAELADWLAKTYHDVPIAETRRMIGEAAAEIYGFDLAALATTRRPVGCHPAVAWPDRRRSGHRRLGGPQDRREALVDRTRLPSVERSPPVGGLTAARELVSVSGVQSVGGDSSKRSISLRGATVR